MLRTAEYVSPLHPDKICDTISDTILDKILEQDPDSRVAVETMGGHGEIKVTGEVTTTANVNYEEIIQSVVGDKYDIQTNIVQQSREIGDSVDTGGAGDQGIMIGYACNKNEVMMPHELYLARDLCKTIFEHHPTDGKTQITLNEDDEIVALVCSFCGIQTTKLSDLVMVHWLQKQRISNEIKIFVNPAGEWSTGGFYADAGVTGRKLIVDNYGPQVPIGGGAFSGKDPTKVDRSGAYAARHIAVKTLKEYDANEVICKIAYAIGFPEPVMVTIFADGKDIIVMDDLTVNGIINNFDLKRPIYKETAMWGPFGNGFQWDNI